MFKKNKDIRSVVDVLDGVRKDADNNALRISAERGKSDSNFKGYLSANMQPPARILRRERRIFRNKIIVTAIFIFLILYIIIYLLLVD